MGYTHYWDVSQDDREAYKGLLTDAKAIVFTALLDNNISIANGFGEGDPELTDEHICFNGVGPDDDHETFHWPVAGNQGFNFCKTAQKPYDTVVCAILLAAKHWYGNKVKVRSDGTWDEWKLGRTLYTSATGKTSPAVLEG